MIYTSNFSKNGNHENAVSICGKSPAFYTGQEYKNHSDVDIRVRNSYGECYEDDFDNINIVHIDFDDGEGIEVMEAVEEHFVIEAW